MEVVKEQFSTVAAIINNPKLREFLFVIIKSRLYELISSANYSCFNEVIYSSLKFLQLQIGYI